MKTAVEWLVENAEDFFGGLIAPSIIEQAKQMEKEQIIEAFEAAEKDCGRDFLHGHLYYNETFKSE